MTQPLAEPEARPLGGPIEDQTTAYTLQSLTQRILALEQRVLELESQLIRLHK